MATIQILFDGVDITESVRFSDARFVSVAGKEAGQAQLRVRDKEHVFTPGFFHVGGTVELLIDGQREWDGWAMVIGREWAFPVDITETPVETPRFIVLECYDRNLLFSKRFHFDQDNPINTMIGDYPAGVSDQAVVLDVLANYTSLQDDDLDIVSGITEVGPIDPYEKINVIETGMPWGTFMDKIVKYNGAVYYIDPDRVVRYVDDVTATAPFALSDEPEAGEVGYREMLIRFVANELANEAFVWGVGVGNDDPVFAHVISEDSVAEHGRFQHGETVQGMYVERSVYRRADTFVNGSPSHQRGHKEDRVVVECVIFEPGLRVGMGVDFHSGVWDFGDLTFDPVDIVSPGNFDKNTEFERLLFQIGKIESNNNYTRQNRRSFAYGRWQVMPANWRVWGPEALGLPRSSGVASRDIDPANWYPPPTPENQDRVVRWRMGQMYKNKGQDPRRVAASWRSGPSVGSRQPSTWSRGTIFYVNHACMPLGYAQVTPATILGDVSEPDLDYVDYQTPVNVDDVLPVRKMEMTFPTPTSVRYALTLSHSYDEEWAWKDPLPSDPDPTGNWYSETIALTGYPGYYDAVEPVPVTTPGTEYTLGKDYTCWLGSSSGGCAPSAGGTGIYSSRGIDDNAQFVYPWFDPMTPGECHIIGPGSWGRWETREAWYQISAEFAQVNQATGFEIVLPAQSELGGASGYVPALTMRFATGDPEFGAGDVIGTIPMGSPSMSGTPERDPQPGGGYIPAGSFTGAGWFVLAPGWQCNVSDAPICDPYYHAAGSDTWEVCSGRGPRCTGEGDSGVYTLSGPVNIGLIARFVPTVSGWNNTPGAGTQNAPQTMWVDGVYRTLFPYTPHTLEVTWQGVRLLDGVAVIEVDPARGLFQLVGLGSGEGSITVRYFVPVGSAPTDPIPGEPATIHQPAGATGPAVEAVIAEAHEMLGTPYVLGAESRQATDCSGLIFRIFTDSGYGALIGNDRKLAAGYTRYFANQGMFSRNLASAQRGDLISYSANGTRVTHIGIYLGGGLTISALTPPYGVTKHKTLGISVPFYGVCMVPYERVRTSSDTTDTSESDTEETQAPNDDLPPQEEARERGVVYSPRPQSQLGWGSESDGVNGLMTCAAMLLDRHTYGTYSDIAGSPRANPIQMRANTGTDLPRSTLTFADVETAWTNGWDENLVTSTVLTWQAFKGAVADPDGGRGAIVLGLTSALPSSLRKSDATGPYALYVNHQLADGTFWVCDPIVHYAQLYRESDLRAFANALWDGVDSVSAVFSKRTAYL